MVVQVRLICDMQNQWQKVVPTAAMAVVVDT